MLYLFGGVFLVYLVVGRVVRALVIGRSNEH